MMGCRNGEISLIEKQKTANRTKQKEKIREKEKEMKLAVNCSSSQRKENKEKEENKIHSRKKKTVTEKDGWFAQPEFQEVFPFTHCLKAQSHIQKMTCD